MVLTTRSAATRRARVPTLPFSKACLGSRAISTVWVLPRGCQPVTTLLEAARCGEIRPVPVKTVELQTIQAIHLVRTQWQTARVARINATRGLLLEHGYAIPVGALALMSQTTV